MRNAYICAAQISSQPFFAPPRSAPAASTVFISTFWDPRASFRKNSLVEPNLNEAQTWQQSGILDPGEAEALALARQLQADWFLTDDTAARVMAASLGVEAHGSLGLVLWSAATHLERDEAEQRLDALVASSLWISATVLAEARSALNRLFG